MTKKVLAATMHSQSNYLPGVGDIGKSLPSSSKVLENLDMSISELGLGVKFSYKGLKHSVLFPVAAVQFMSLELGKND